MISEFSIWAEMWWHFQGKLFSKANGKSLFEIEILLRFAWTYIDNLINVYQIGFKYKIPSRTNCLVYLVIIAPIYLETCCFLNPRNLVMMPLLVLYQFYS